MSAGSVAQDQIKSFFERWQRLEEEKEAISGDLKELFAEAKGNGFDTKVLRVVFRDKTKDQSERSEFEAVYDLYWSALGTPIATGAHPAHEDDFDAETGEVLETKSTAARKDVRLSPTVEGTAGAKGGIVDAPDTPSEPAGTQAPPVDTNVTAFRTHDPATHFLNSKGLARLHGCQGPEACASSQPRSKLCFACSVAHDGPVASEASA